MYLTYTSGKRDKIQLSQETADLLIAAGKTNWLSQREDVVHAKGKGEMQTYWLEIMTRNGSSVMDTSSMSGSSERLDFTEEEHATKHASRAFDSKTTRLIEWNVDVLLRLLKQIVARRRACLTEGKVARPNESFFYQKKDGMTLDEVAEIITLPAFSETNSHLQEEADNVVLDPIIIQQLHDYVCNIAAIYRDNPFHNCKSTHVVLPNCFQGPASVFSPY